MGTRSETSMARSQLAPPVPGGEGFTVTDPTVDSVPDSDKLGDLVMLTTPRDAHDTGCSSR